MNQQPSVYLQMKELIYTTRCKCGGKLYNKTQGNKICYCTECGRKYVAKTVRKIIRKKI